MGCEDTAVGYLLDFPKTELLASEEDPAVVLKLYSVKMKTVHRPHVLMTKKCRR